MKNKLTACKTCGAEIAMSAKTCPACGAKNKVSMFKRNPVGAFTLLAIVIIFFIFVFSSINNGETSGKSSEKVDTLSDTNGGEKEDSINDAKVFAVGDVVSINDIEVTLVSVSENNGGNYMTPTDGNVFVVCEFEINNKSNNDIAVSSIMSFEAYVDDYSTAMNLSATLSTDVKQLDGNVAAGKKINGVVGYEAPSDWSEIEVRFTPSFWSNKEAVFVVNEKDVAVQKDTQTPSNSEHLILGAGTYVVGKDIPAGEYNCKAASGLGVLRGDVASLSPVGLIVTMGESTASVGDDSVTVSATDSYSNLQLTDGDKIYIEMSLEVEFILQ
jgi:hypothetical protein